MAMFGYIGHIDRFDDQGVRCSTISDSRPMDATESEDEGEPAHRGGHIGEHPLVSVIV